MTRLNVFSVLAVLFFACFGQCEVAKADVLIQTIPQNSFQVRSADIFNTTITNSSGVEASVYLVGEIKDPTGKPMVRIQSESFVLQGGSNLITPMKVGIAKVTYFDSEFKESEARTGFLRVGSYRYCLRLVCVSSDEICKKLMDVENPPVVCDEIAVENVTPLLLSMPDDESEIEETRPNFSWIPPMPVGTDPNLKYSITLVHLNPDQTAEEGVRRNRPIYQRSGIEGVVLMFPATLEDLIPGEKYGWQVHAELGSNRIASSEIWEFKIKDEPPVGLSTPSLSMASGSYYHSLVKGQTAFNVKGSEIVYNKKDSTLNFEIVNSAGEVVLTEVDFQPVKVNHWSTTYVFLSICNKDLIKGRYKLRILSREGTYLFHQFEIDNSSCQ